MLRFLWILPAVFVWLRGAPAPAAQDPDELLAQRLEWFRDQKFGLFLHWGIYSRLGCIESWPLVWADRSWANPVIRTYEEMLAFRRIYFIQHRAFDPRAFNPRDWARVARRAGMRYVMFTSKHHDGFCMFDTRQTDFRITSPECPYSRSANPDILKQVFEAFREEGLAIGCYFSKSDWHHPAYWDPDRPALDRNPNYDTSREPHRWQQFVRFVHAQVEELMSNYGRIDILWLDGGQVRPPAQDIDMDRLARMARRYQPHLIIVDRTAGTRHENYRTPEQEVPDAPLPYAWETCMTMGQQWSFKPDDQYKSSRQLIHLLVDIVAKGGNFLLNIGPQPDGQLPQEAVRRLEDIARWMDVNAQAIHSTRPLAPYKLGNFAFTRRGETVYAIYLAKGEDDRLPGRLTIPGPRPANGSELHLLGVDRALAWQAAKTWTTVQIPPEVVSKPPCQYAYTFRFTIAGQQ